MQHTSVEKLFKEQIKRYAKRGQYEKSPLFQLVVKQLKSKKFHKTISICEFGGGVGELLGEIQKVYPRVSLTNVEIINDYKRHLVSRKIKFVLGSVLNSKFKDSSFDIIIIRDVLHHLVGRNYTETQSNQKLALYELRRLVKPKGAIFIEELTNESEFATRIIYNLCRLNSKIGIHIPALFVSSHAIVAFLTSNKLLNFTKSVFGKKNIRVQVQNLETKWHFQILHLFSGLKKVIIIIKN